VVSLPRGSRGRTPCPDVQGTGGGKGEAGREVSRWSLKTCAGASALLGVSERFALPFGMRGLRKKRGNENLLFLM